MKDESVLFRLCEADSSKLQTYGFVPTDGGLRCERSLLGGQFRLIIELRGGAVYTELVDTDFGEPYTLHLVTEAQGSYVSEIKTAYADALAELRERCFTPSVYTSAAAKAVLQQAEKLYGEQPEFLWSGYPEYAVLRCAETGKWYAVLMTCAPCKFGGAGEEKAEILNVHLPAECVARLVDCCRVFPAYHMNKKHWVTLLLQGGLAPAEILQLVAESRCLAQHS